MKHPAIHRYFKWLDANILLLCAGLLLFFIPLYPKIPLFSPIEQYIVRVRIEDLLVAIIIPLTLIQMFRHKIRLPKGVTILMIAYAVVGVLSVLSGMFITQTIPLQSLHVAKSLLHYFRYLEYFSVFLVTFAAVRSWKDARKLLIVLAITVTLISSYGYLQKFFYWPVYSTMNREFSKGIRLVLTEHARIQSTFAGHYDMAAYLVIVLPIILSLAFVATRKWVKVSLYLSFISGFWLMVMSASRIPFLAFLIGIFFVVILHALVQKPWQKAVRLFFVRSILLLLCLIFMLFYFGQTLLDRVGNFVSSADHPINLTQELDTLLAPLPIPKSTQLIAWLPKAAARPEEAAPAPDLEAAIIAQVASISDQPPVPVTTPTPQLNRPRDVYVDVPEPVVQDVVQPDGSVQRQVIHKSRSYSDCALTRELSLCIRLESLWPWALQSFHTNPILGTGYATLNKQFVDEFTIADGTDNNYLRTLGETGILGFITFYGIILFLLARCIQYLNRSSTIIVRPYLIGFIAGSIGLLVNATYIDVYAASKVAYTYWMLAGLATTLLVQIQASQKSTSSKTKKIASSSRHKKRTEISK